MKWLKADVLVALLIIVCMIEASFQIISAVYGYERPGVRAATWSPPEIAQCHKPLWERIKDGCDET